MVDAPSRDVRFGRYRLERSVACGGMAEIFLARQVDPPGFERRLVIKRILPGLAKSPRFVELFVDEARVAGQLQHPNVVALYDFGEIDGTYFLAMELVRGPSLRDLGRAADQAGLRLPFEVVAKIGAGVAAGLSYAHTLLGPNDEPLNVVHRDISPSNVVISEHGVPKILDFGIAKAASSTHQTLTGEIKGKVPYMSPEQVLGDPLDGRADLYALGVVLYQLICGRRPYLERGDFALMQRICEGRPTPPREITPDLPEALERVILTAMAADLDRRYGSARELWNELEQFSATIRGPVSDFDVAEQVRRIERAYGEPLNAITAITGSSQLSAQTPASTPRQPPTVSATPRGRDSGSSEAEGERSPPHATAVTTPLRTPPSPSRSAHDASPRSPSLTPKPDRVWDRRGIAAGLGLVALLALSGVWLAKRDAPPPERHLEGPVRTAVFGSTPDASSPGPSTPDASPPDLAAPPPAPNHASADAGADRATKQPRRRRQPERPAGRAPRASPGAPTDGYLVLTTTPWTEVFLGEQRLGVTPTRVALPAGVHRLRLRNRDQGLEHILPVRVRAGAEVSRKLDLRPATVSLLVKPWGDVFVNGQRRGTTPLAPLRLTPGRHRIDVVQPRTGRRERRDITLSPQERVELKIDLSEEQ